DANAREVFGGAVAINGDAIVVGACHSDYPFFSSGAAYVFVRRGGVWSQQQKLTAGDAASYDAFGCSVAISGNTVVVGAPAFNMSAPKFPPGSAYVFERIGSLWIQEAKLNASDGVNGDFFGFSVAISGNTVVVGAPFGDSAAASDSGSVYVFKPVGSPSIQESKLTASDAAPYDRFGASVAIRGDLVAAGAPGADTPNAAHAGGVYLASFGEP